MRAHLLWAAGSWTAITRGGRRWVGWAGPAGLRVSGGEVAIDRARVPCAGTWVGGGRCAESTRRDAILLTYAHLPRISDGCANRRLQPQPTQPEADCRRCRAATAVHQQSCTFTGHFTHRWRLKTARVEAPPNMYNILKHLCVCTSAAHQRW